MGYIEIAIKAYANDDERKRKKAMDAAIAIENALKKEYSKVQSITHCHFMTDNWLAYFSYEALGSERIKLLYG